MHKVRHIPEHIWNKTVPIFNFDVHEKTQLSKYVKHFKVFITSQNDDSDSDQNRS